MHEILFWIIIAIIVLDFLFEKYLGYLNTTKWSDVLPDEVKGIYDEEKYKKQQAYQRENYRFGLLTSSFSFTITLSMIVFYGFALVNGWAWEFTSNAILAALIFFGILMFASDLLSIPFDVYDTFKIEEKYGFNKTTVKTFVFDKLKGWLIGALIGGGMLALIIFIYQKTQNSFWIYAWIVVSAFSIFMAMFYSNLIVPLFNKQTPLEDGELRIAIKTFSDRVGFKLDNIFVINGSKTRDWAQQKEACNAGFDYWYSPNRCGFIYFFLAHQQPSFKSCAGCGSTQFPHWAGGIWHFVFARFLCFGDFYELAFQKK